MKAGVEKQYKFGQKNNWRRRVWNEAASRIADKKSALVLYMPGPNDLDRPIALSKGFSNNNLIGIERHRETAKSLRQQKKNIVIGNAEQFLTGWDFTQQFDFIHFDFCCGLTENVIRAVELAQLAAKPGAPICVNLLRGREAKSGIKQLQAELKEVDEMIVQRGMDSLFRGGIKHRGHLLAYWLMARSRDCVNRARSRLSHEDYLNAMQQRDEHLQNARPLYFSYRSGLLIMDSFFANFGLGCANLHDHRLEKFRDKRLAAMWAVRTMRQKGILKHPS